MPTVYFTKAYCKGKHDLENSRCDLERDELLRYRAVPWKDSLSFKTSLPSAFPFRVAGKTAKGNNNNAYFAEFLYTFCLTISSRE